ncbi:MAG: polymer-forming cytoskeletal protein [Rubrivivax sp.]|nr:polymer-forming cytoskeletal protein [Rubrivivax sp.]
MSPTLDDKPNDPLSEATADALEIGMGKTLPPQAGFGVPLLRTQTQGLAAARSRGLPPPNCTTLAEGLHFVGTARLSGACSIAGHFEGQLSQPAGALASVVVTETGSFKGDITAHKISVMGRTEGLLDAGSGEVSLHDNAQVQGRVRYGRIVVNGADLNATLERVGSTPTRN